MTDFGKLDLLARMSGTNVTLSNAQFIELIDELRAKEKEIFELKVENEKLKKVEEKYREAVPFLALHGWDGMSFTENG